MGQCHGVCNSSTPDTVAAADTSFVVDEEPCDDLPSPSPSRHLPAATVTSEEASAGSTSDVLPFVKKSPSHPTTNAAPVSLPTLPDEVAPDEVAPDVSEAEAESSTLDAVSEEELARRAEAMKRAAAIKQGAALRKAKQDQLNETAEMEKRAAAIALGEAIRKARRDEDAQTLVTASWRGSALGVRPSQPYTDPPTVAVGYSSSRFPIWALVSRRLAT